MQLREWLLFQPDEYRCVRAKRAIGEYPFVWHYHEHYELMVIEQGTGHWLIGDQTGQYQPGDLFLLSPRLPHAFFTPYTATSPQADPVTPQDNLVVMFNLHDPAAGFNGLPELRELAPLFQRAERGLYFSGAITASLAPQIASLTRASGLTVLVALLQLLQALLSRSEKAYVASPHYQTSISTRQANRVNKLCQYLHEHFTEPLTLPQLAEEMNTSVPHLCALFKDYTDRTVMGYIQELRISHACHQLLTTDLPITVVALQSGFSSLSNFNRRFHALRGCSPREYRKDFCRYAVTQ